MNMTQKIVRERMSGTIFSITFVTYTRFRFFQSMVQCHSKCCTSL